MFGKTKIWSNAFRYGKTCVRQPTLKLTLLVDVERWLSYKGTCHVILLAKLHDMYLYKTDNFFHINHYLNAVSKVALLHRFYCTFNVCVCSKKLALFISLFKLCSYNYIYIKQNNTANKQNKAFKLLRKVGTCKK